MTSTRIAERYRLNPTAPAQIRVAGDCEVVDLSECGALLRHDFDLDELRQFFLSVETPAASILLQSRVVWTRRNENGYFSGVRFQPAGPPLRQVIDDLVASQRATPTESFA